MSAETNTIMTDGTERDLIEESENIPSLSVDWNSCHEGRGEDWIMPGKTFVDRWDYNKIITVAIDDDGLRATFDEYGPAAVFAYYDDGFAAMDDDKDEYPDYIIEGERRERIAEIRTMAVKELCGTPYERDMACYLLMTTGRDQYGFDKYGLDEESRDACGDYRKPTRNRWGWGPWGE